MNAEQQWVELGVTAGCFPSPLTCSDQGATMAFWLRRAGSSGYVFSSYEEFKYAFVLTDHGAQGLE